MSIQREAKFNKHQARTYVAKQLAAKKTPEETARMLANAGDMSWEVAQQYVFEVQRSYKGAIARRQFIGAVFGALVMAAIGIFLLALNARYLEREFGLVPFPNYEEWRGELLPIPILSIPIYSGTNEYVVYAGVGLLALAALSVLLGLVRMLRP